MKSFIKPLVFILFYFFFMTETGFAQIPQKLVEQGRLLDAVGNPQEGTFNLRLSIFDSTATGPQLWQEVQSITTNSLGLFTINLGDLVLMDSIDWSYGLKFLKMELDTGSNNFIDMGTTQMMSVPYALFAGNSALSSDNRWTLSGLNIYNNNSGNVGIGTNTPSRKLSVKGKVSIGENVFDSLAPGNGLVVLGTIDPKITDRDSAEAMQIPIFNLVHMIADSGSVYSGGIRQDVHNPSWTGFFMRATVNETGRASEIDFYGISDSTNIIGNSITGIGRGNMFIGNVTKNEPVGNGGWGYAKGADIRLIARHTVTGSDMNLKGTSDSAVVIGNKITATGGKVFTGFQSTLTEDELYMVFAKGIDVNLNAKYSVTGSNMNLKGNSDSAVTIGSNIFGTGIGKSFTGVSVNTIPYRPTGSALWYKHVIGSDMNLTAFDSVIGTDVILNSGSDSTKMIGLRIKAGPNAGFGGLNKRWCVAVKVTDDGGSKSSTGVDLKLSASEIVNGQKMILTGTSDSSKVTGMRVVPQGSGKKFRGFSTSFLPEVDDETLVIFTAFKNATGSELMVTGTDSVIGADIIVDNGSDSTKVMGLRIKAGPNAAAADSSSKRWCFKVIATDDGWRKTTGTDLVLGAPQSVTGHKLMLSGTSDSSEISGITVIPQGKGNRFIAFRDDPYAEDGARDLPKYKTAIGSDFHLYAKDSIRGSAYYINSSDANAPCDAIVNYSIVKTSGNGWAMDTHIEAADTAGGINTTLTGMRNTSTLIGNNIEMNGQGASAKGFRFAIDSYMYFEGISDVYGCEINFNNTNAATARGVVVKSSNQGVNIGGDFDISGGTNNIGLRSVTNGIGAAAIFNGTGGASGLLVPNGNVGIGTSTPSSTLDVAGITQTTNLRMTSGAAAGSILQGDGSGNASWVNPDALVITNIADSLIVNADVSPTAAIAYAKLQLSNSIVSGDLVDGTIVTVDLSDNAVTSPKIVDGTVVNADVSPTAAIAYAKLNLTNSVVNGDIVNGTIDLTTKVTGTLPIAKGGTNATSFTTANKFLIYDGTGLVSSVYDQNSFAAPVPISYEAGVQPLTAILNNVLTTVIYGLPSFNDGAAYNPATGIFTAPATGKYHFDASVMWQAVAAGPQYNMQLNVNGVPKKTTYNTFNFAQDFNQSMSIDLSLNAGDQVKITIIHNSVVPKNILGGLTACTFSGHQLY